MLFKVGNEIIDTEKVPVGLIFNNAEEANRVAAIISTIKDGGDSELPKDRNGRWWFMMPTSWDKETTDKWSTLSEDQKTLLETTTEVSEIRRFEL